MIEEIEKRIMNFQYPEKIIEEFQETVLEAKNSELSFFFAKNIKVK